MSNLSEYAKNYKPSEHTPLSKEEKNDIKEKLEQTYHDYKDLSQDELLEELFKKSKEQKENGTFDYNSLKNTVDMISNYLNENQKNKIYSLLESLK